MPILPRFRQEYVETKFVGQRGRPVGLIHERVDFWVEHFHPDPYVQGILDQGFKVPVDWDNVPESKYCRSRRLFGYDCVC
jgi:hypothetical protein